MIGAMPVIELTTFRLADAVDEPAFLDVDERVRTGFLYTRPGIIRSTTARSADGEWALLVLWWDEESADAAAAAASSDPAWSQLTGMTHHVERRRWTDLDG